MSDYKIETKCIQSGYTPKNGEPRILPIYQSTTFKYDNSDEMGKLFDLEASGYFYTRLQNPTNDAVAAKICDMEGGVAGMLTSSGQSANFYAIMPGRLVQFAIMTPIYCVLTSLLYFSPLTGMVVGNIRTAKLEKKTV